MTAAAGTGIGSSTARRALAEGADVVVSDYHERRLGETRDELAALGLGRVDAVVVRRDVDRGRRRPDRHGRWRRWAGSTCW